MKYFFGRKKEPDLSADKKSLTDEVNALKDFFDHSVNQPPPEERTNFLTKLFNKCGLCLGKGSSEEEKPFAQSEEPGKTEKSKLLTK